MYALWILHRYKLKMFTIFWQAVRQTFDNNWWVSLASEKNRSNVCRLFAKCRQMLTNWVSLNSIMWFVCNGVAKNVMDVAGFRIWGVPGDLKLHPSCWRSSCVPRRSTAWQSRARWYQLFVRPPCLRYYVALWQKGARWSAPPASHWSSARQVRRQEQLS